MERQIPAFRKLTDARALVSLEVVRWLGLSGAITEDIADEARTGTGSEEAKNENRHKGGRKITELITIPRTLAEVCTNTCVEVRTVGLSLVLV